MKNPINNNAYYNTKTKRALNDEKKWKKNFYCIEIIDITKYYSENLPFKQYIFASGNHTSAYLTLMFNF